MYYVLCCVLCVMYRCPYVCNVCTVWYGMVWVGPQLRGDQQVVNKLYGLVLYVV